MPATEHTDVNGHVLRRHCKDLVIVDSTFGERAVVLNNITGPLGSPSGAAHGPVGLRPRRRRPSGAADRHGSDDRATHVASRAGERAVVANNIINPLGSPSGAVHAPVGLRPW